MPAPAYARYVDFARSGKAPTPYRPPKGLKAEQAWQKQQLEKSLRYCKDVLGLGLKK